MHFKKRYKMDDSNPFMDEYYDDDMKEEIRKCTYDNVLHAVPFVTFDFFDALRSDRCTTTAPDTDGDVCDEEFCFKIEPLATALRVMIRPDMSKGEAVRILNKIIKKISEDTIDWDKKFKKIIADLTGEETDTD